MNVPALFLPRSQNLFLLYPVVISCTSMTVKKGEGDPILDVLCEWSLDVVRLVEAGVHSVPAPEGVVVVQELAPRQHVLAARPSYKA